MAKTRGISEILYILERLNPDCKWKQVATRPEPPLSFTNAHKPTCFKPIIF